MRVRSLMFSAGQVVRQMETRRMYALTTCVTLWLAYASLYTTRKPLGIVKSTVERDLSLNRAQTGWLDVAFLLPYAIVQMIWGHTVDRVHPRWVMGAGALCSSLAMMCFSYSTSFDSLYLSLFVIGSSTSLLWPAVSHATQEWYRGSSRINFVFGVMGNSSFAGGVLATLVSSALFANYGWRWAYYDFGVFLFFVGAVCAVFVKLPRDIVGLPEYVNAHTVGIPENSLLSGSTNFTEKEMEGGMSSDTSSTSTWNTFRKPYIAHFCVMNFLLKMLRYFLYFWLPMYLEHQLSYSAVQAGYLSVSFDLGGALGPLVLGAVVDRSFPDQPGNVIAFAVISSIVSLLMFFIMATNGLWTCFLSLFLCGFFACGVDPLMSGSIPQEQAGGAGVGLVNGFGTVGALLEGPVVAFMSSYWNWDVTLATFVVLSAGAGAVSLHAARTKGIIGQFNRSGIGTS